jgi:hypothetical protein
MWAFKAVFVLLNVLVFLCSVLYITVCPFIRLSFSLFIVCPSTIYGFWSLLMHLQTFSIIIRDFYKMQWSLGSWICCFKHYSQQSMRKLYFVGFEFLSFAWNKKSTKSTKIRTPRLIMIAKNRITFMLSLCIN